jgi:hypothetical protein
MTTRVASVKSSAQAAARKRNAGKADSKFEPAPMPLLNWSCGTLRIQPKLEVGAVDHPMEREAESVAERVMQMPESRGEHAVPIVATSSSGLNRKCTCGGTCSHCRQKQGVPRTQGAGPGGMQAPPLVSEVLRSPGEPLDAATRAFMEPRFGYDFSGVVLHADSRAAESARAIHARAYAAGRHIVFAEGEYNPNDIAGRRLLGHELTHVVQGGGTDVIRRDPAPVPASTADRRMYVQATIDFLKQSAQFYRDPIVSMSAGLFERLIDNWYLMVVEREKTIDDDLSGDVLLKRALHSAYIEAIRVLVSKAAPVLKKSEPDVYRENSGRIPMWAWPTPHHTETGISTPIPEGRAADPLSGNVDFATNGMSVSILPDASRPALGKSAETKINIAFGGIHYITKQMGGKTVIDSFTGPGALSVQIQSFFGSGATAASPSGYGRGTTPEDIAGGRITPRSTSLGFHEGSHGLDFVEFLQNNPPPAFTGSVGMTESDFKAAITAWHNAISRYRKSAEDFSLRRTDCVGTTLDRFNQANAAPGATITLVCPP